MQNKLPQFEANQVLSNVHLNQFIEYLEEQGRLTRNHLLGNGIVSGLEVKRVSSISISIYEGVAVTSAGYLVLPDSLNWSGPDETGRRFTSYDRRKIFEPQNLLFPHEGDFEKLSESYSLFKNIDPKNIFQLLETDPLPPTDVKIKKLTADELNNGVVILFHQIKVKELKNCEGDDCIDLGKELTYTAIPLLISKTDAHILLQNENKFSPALIVATSDALMKPAWNLEDVVIGRPDLSSVSEKIDIGQLAEVYKSVLTELKNELTEVRVNKIDSLLKLITKENINPMKAFSKKLDDILGTGGFIKQQELFQYAYDFATDFIHGYRELQDAVYEFNSFEMPGIEMFPYHIRLGSVPSSGKMISSNQYPPDVYRHGFTSSRIIEKQRPALNNVLLLSQRLAAIVENFFVEINFENIRITPAVEMNTQLSQQAIPFYYKPINDRPALINCWSPLLYRQSRLDRLLNYYDNCNTSDRDKPGKKGGNEAPLKPLHFPLQYQHDQQDFYRVEGHIGVDYTQVFEIINRYIRNYNLSFDIQLVRLNSDTKMEIKDQQILFHDLESLYNVIREEIRCLLSTELNYFMNIKLTHSVRGDIVREPRREVITAELVKPEEESTFVELPEKSKRVLFYNAKSKRSEMKGAMLASKYSKPVNLGINESFISIANKLGDKQGVIDVTGIIGGAFGVNIFRTKPTLAAPYVSKMITSIKELQKTLDTNFYDFNAGAYEAAVEAMHSETRSFIVFAKSTSAAIMSEECNIEKEELLNYLERVLYECDFEKPEAIDEEKGRREQLLGVNNYLQKYIEIHPGIEHKAGVWKGGTFVVIFEDGVSVADFCLPYRCCSGSGATQFVLGLLHTVWVEGLITDLANAPLSNAVVMINDKPVPVDKNGRYRKSVAANTFVVIKVRAENFEPAEVSFTTETENLTQNFTLLTRAQEPKVNLELHITDSANKPLPAAVVKLGDENKTLNNNGDFKGQIRANASFTLTISLDGFITRVETINAGASDIKLVFQLIKLIKLKGTVIDFNNAKVLNPSVLVNDILIQVNENRFETELEESKTYRLSVSAKDLQTDARDIIAGNSDINLAITLQKIQTLSVRVGVYISSRISVPPRIREMSRHTTLEERRLSRTEITGVGGRRVIGGVTGRVHDSTVIAGGAGVTAPPVQPPEEFSLLGKERTSSSVNDILQSFNNNLRLFESQEIKSAHNLAVKESVSKLDFRVFFKVEDHDLLALIPADEGYKSDSAHSFLIGAEGGPDAERNIKMFNEFMQRVFNVPAGQNVAAGKSIDVRVFRLEDARELGELLKAARVKFQHREI